MAKITQEDWEKHKLSESVQRMYVEYHYRQNKKDLYIRFGFGSATNPNVDESYAWELAALQDASITHVSKHINIFNVVKNTIPLT